MNKTMWNKWRRYLIVSFIGILLFSILIPSCTYLSSANFDVLVRDKKPEAIANKTKSLAEIVAGIPTVEQIQAMPLREHPRLLVSADRFAQMKRQIETDVTMKRWYDKLYSDAEQFLLEKPSFYKLENSIGMILVSQTAVIRVETLAIIYKLTGDRRYLERVWQEVAAIAKFPDWNPNHFLDTAEMTFAMAIAYDWLYSDWNQDRRELIRTIIIDKGLKPALKDYAAGVWWTKAENNWNQVCNSGIAIGSIAIIDSETELSTRSLFEAIKRLPLAMKNYAPDGAWNEGISYWHYGTSYNTQLLATLDTAFATDFSLSEIAGYSKTGFFPIYMTGTSGYSFNFADARRDAVSAPELFWLSKRFQEPAFAEYQREFSTIEPLDLIWYEQATKISHIKTLEKDRYFRDTEVVSMRDDWNDKALFVGFKGGNNQAVHSNLDLGTFVLDALGVRWAIELGNDNYRLPGYFEANDKRWSYYRLRTEGQNTIAIAKDRYPRQNLTAKAKIINTSFHKNRAFAVTNLKSAYSTTVSQLDRGIMLDRKQHFVLIQDELKSKHPLILWWSMHTRADIQLDRNGTSAMLYRDGVRLWMKILSPANAHFEVMEAKPFASSPNPMGQADNEGIKKVTINLKNTQDTTLSVLMIPLEAEKNLPQVLPSIKRTSQW